ncbi:MAG TPA: ATP-binding protein [Anaerolineae bacterium]|nr:ATP-binding protein [Anaerolineae bacterium]
MPLFANISAIHSTPLPGTGQAVGLFGYHLPYLPDFLADHTLLGEQPASQLTEVLSRFERLILGLRKYRHSAYALRFTGDPQEGRIDVDLLGRITAPAQQVQAYARYAAADLDAHLTGYGLPHIPLADGEGSEAVPPSPTGRSSSLARVCRPFDGNVSVVELRQHEEIVHFHTVQSEAYVIHPYWGPTGPCLEPFEVLLRQPAPAAISIYLEPTELAAEERKSLSEAAHLAQTLSDMQVQTYSGSSISRWRDPGAELVSRIYEAYYKSLTEPFILVVQVASPDPNTAWTVARAFASALIPSQPLAQTAAEARERDLPSQADIVAPRSVADRSAASRTFENLVWFPWGATLATSDKQRLRYLVGARGAATAFRFPVSVRGGLPGIAVRQMPPDFEPGPRPRKPGPDEVHLGDLRRGGVATVNRKALTRHTLITGFTGSGKTNTVLYLLDQLWRKHQVPFLVLESAKKEYRALQNVAGFEDLLIFTLGDETTSPFRLNPFELLPGVRLEAHLGKLQTCFDAALPQFGILPSIIAEAMERIYRNKGWRLTDRAQEQETRLFPTMREMASMVLQVAGQRGYKGETAANVRAAAHGRIGSLLRGSRGLMFDCQRSLSASSLLQRPVILEMNDLNQEDKALTMMFLLMWLREYRELHPQSRLQHVTVVEEAHNVISNVQSVGSSEAAADTRARAVAAFSDMLAEVRAYGEGIIISDQSPEKLAPDAMRNTNLQIAHQLRDRRDREAVARAMIMEEAQQNYLGKLRVGEAALFLTGMEKATFITIPNYKDQAGFDELPSDAQVQERMSAFRQQHATAYLPTDGCRFCGSPCRYREKIAPLSRDRKYREPLHAAIKLFDKYRNQPHRRDDIWSEIVKVCREAAQAAGYADQLDAAYCYLAHSIDYFAFSSSMRDQFVRAFRKAHS